MESKEQKSFNFEEFKENIIEKTKYIMEKQNRFYLVIVSLLVVIFTYLFIYNSTKAYSVILNSKQIGYLKTEEEGLELLEELESDIKEENDISIYLDDVVKFEKDNVLSKNISSKDALKDVIKPEISYKVSAYVMEIDGEPVGEFKSGKEAEEVLDEIKATYIVDDAKYDSVEILEKIDIKTRKVLLPELDTKESVLNYIKTGGESTKTHTVEVGESFWTIAKIYGTTVEAIEKANPGVVPEKLWPGDEVKLIEEVSKLTVVTTETKDIVEDIVAEVDVKYDDGLFKNQKTVKQEGSNGEKKKTIRYKKHNGNLVEEEVLSEEVTKEPVAKIVVQGTKEVPKTVATGSFMMPTRGRISSRYGSRWGRQHRGLDIAARTGTPIKAADGGKVTQAGWNGLYGYMVEIDHGNGYKTRYAHCSKLLAKVGKKVAKGDHIANVGNTGRSTGAHLHLEVLKNGVHQNPSSYVE